MQFIQGVTKERKDHASIILMLLAALIASIPLKIIKVKIAAKTYLSLL